MKPYTSFAHSDTSNSRMDVILTAYPQRSSGFVVPVKCTELLRSTLRRCQRWFPVVPVGVSEVHVGAPSHLQRRLLLACWTRLAVESARV